MLSNTSYSSVPQILAWLSMSLWDKGLGCLLGSDICHIPPGSSCMTLLIKNSKLLSPVLGPFHYQMVTTCLLRCIPSLVPPTLSSCSLTFSFLSCRATPCLPCTCLPPQPTADRPLPSGTLEFIRPTSFSLGCLLPTRQQQSLAASLFDFFYCFFPSSLSPSRRLFSLLTLHGSCALKFEPLLPSHITLTRDFALLPWLQPATTYCSLLKLNVEPQSCQFALCTPLPYFQLANIGYISLFIPALPLDPSPF